MTETIGIAGFVCLVVAIVCLIVSWVSLLTLSIATYKGAIACREDALERTERSAAKDAATVRTLASVAIGLCLSVPLAAFVVTKIAVDRLRDLTDEDPDPRFRRAVRCAIIGVVIAILGLVLLLCVAGVGIVSAQPSFSYSDPSSPLDSVSGLLSSTY